MSDPRCDVVLRHRCEKFREHAGRHYNSWDGEWLEPEQALIENAANEMEQVLSPPLMMSLKQELCPDPKCFKSLASKMIKLATFDTSMRWGCKECRAVYYVTHAALMLHPKHEEYIRVFKSSEPLFATDAEKRALQSP